MRPAPFEYVRATSVVDALERIGPAHADAVLLAGGQTLIREMRDRDVSPRRVIDLSAITELVSIERDGDTLVVGALTPLARLSHPPVAEACPALAEAVRRIADVQVRNRATLGGNLCIGAASDVGSVLVAGGGEIVLRTAAGERRVAAAELLARGERPCAPGEMIVFVRFAAAAASAFEKLSRRAVDASIVSAAAVLHRSAGRLRLDLALGAVHRHVVALPAIEIDGGALDARAIEAVVAERARSLEPPSTPHAGADYRRRVAPVLARRAAERAFARLGGENA